MRSLAVAAVVAFVALTLAGCSSAKQEAKPDTPGNPQGLPMLAGFVFDPALRPLVGATVKVLDTNSSLETDKEGGYRFDGLPTEQFLVVVATMSGFVPTSKQITLTVDQPIRLNFTLNPVPVQTPYHTTVKQELLVECQVGIVASTTNNTVKCGTGTQDIDHWDIPVDVNLAGAVIEVFWTPASPASNSVGAKLETLELGQLNLVLGQVVGTSPLRIMVPQSTAVRYYPSGGLMRLTVFAEPNAAENEAGVGASALVEQKLTAYASLFYVGPPDPSFTIGNQA